MRITLGEAARQRDRDAQIGLKNAYELIGEVKCKCITSRSGYWIHPEKLLIVNDRT